MKALRCGGWFLGGSRTCCTSCWMNRVAGVTLCRSMWNNLTQGLQLAFGHSDRRSRCHFYPKRCSKCQLKSLRQVVSHGTVQCHTSHSVHSAGCACPGSAKKPATAPQGFHARACLAISINTNLDHFGSWLNGLSDTMHSLTHNRMFSFLPESAEWLTILHRGSCRCLHQMESRRTKSFTCLGRCLVRQDLTQNFKGFF